MEHHEELIKRKNKNSPH